MATNANLAKDAATLLTLIKNKTVFTGQVSRLGMDENNEPFMVVKIPAANGLAGGYTGVIKKAEADGELQRATLVPMMGRQIAFVITEVDVEKNRVICSRRQAQEALKASMLQDLQNKTVFEGTVVNVVEYGAYIEVNYVTGLMKTNDFSVDRSEVAGVLSIGDKIRVFCKEVTAAGRINWEAETKYHRPDPIEYDFEPNTVVLGTVVNISNFGPSTGVFVRIDDGLDALCTLPQDREVEKGTPVSVKISSVTPNPIEGAPPKVRGKIVRVL